MFQVFWSHTISFVVYRLKFKLITDNCPTITLLFTFVVRLGWKGKERMCGQVWCPMLGICALHLTHPNAHTQKWIHTHTHTHTVNTRPEQWAANAAAPGEQLGVRCLAQGHLSRGIEGGESAVHSLPPPTIPAGPETRTRDLRVTSPTL